MVTPAIQTPNALQGNAGQIKITVRVQVNAIINPRVNVVNRVGLKQTAPLGNAGQTFFHMNARRYFYITAMLIRAASVVNNACRMIPSALPDTAWSINLLVVVAVIVTPNPRTAANSAAKIPTVLVDTAWRLHKAVNPRSPLEHTLGHFRVS